jgi:hypothetical protein
MNVSKSKNLNTCRKCGMLKYSVIDCWLDKAGNFYFQSLKCRHCGYKAKRKFSLLRDGSSKYGTMWISEKKIIIPMHRWVWEEFHRERLGQNDVVHHINSNRSDDRARNLLKMETSDHHPWLGKTEQHLSRKHRLQLVRKRIRRLREIEKSLI